MRGSRYHSKFAQQNRGGRLAFAIVVFEILCLHFAAWIKNIDARIGNAVRRRTLFHGSVQDSVGADDLRFRIRQQRKRDVAPTCEGLENSRAIVANGGKT